MKIKLTKKLMWAAAAGFAIAGCGDDETSSKGSLDIGSVTAPPKSDIGKRAKILEDLAPNSSVQGQFDNNVRVYAYVVNASAGATIDITLKTETAGDASIDDSETLDTVLAVYGPYEDRQNPGEKLMEVDDGDDVAAPTVKFEVPDEGQYMIAFSSWDTPGKSQYDLSLTCEGTDFQCRRANLDKPCKEGKQFIQGGEISEDVEWNSCETVVLETPTVTEEGSLTIKPGVEAKFNFLEGSNDPFGIVGIIAQGPVQAVGTEEHPIRLTSLKDGWAGLDLIGPGHVISHAFIENASVALHLRAEASGEFSDLVLENTDRKGTGVRVESGGKATFDRAVAKGFRTGFHSVLGEDVSITDSTITNNHTAILATGEPSPNVTRCGNPPAPPNRPFRPDPVITHSDIYRNHVGVQVDGDQVLLQIEKSNIVDNTTFALDLRTAILDAESFIRSSNIIRNNQATEEVPRQQVRSFHRNGELKLGGNYWVFISDPELSNNWHAQCQGAIDFSGFEPELIDDAGPREEDLSEDVKKDIWKQQQSE